MQLYIIPVIVICFALFAECSIVLRKSKLIALMLTFFVILSFVLVIKFYQGINTDWQTYREYVDGCDRLGCTYFEPGFDLLTLISAETLGFSLVKTLLLLFYVVSLSVAMEKKARPLLIVIAVASVSVATLPLMLGAIRQSLTLPLLLWAAIFLERQRYRNTLIAIAVASSLHYSALLVAIWYGIFWYMLISKPPSRLVAGVRVLMLIFGTYAVLYVIKNAGLGEYYAILARVGETGAGTDYVNTGGLLRDISIVGERLPFAIISFVLICDRMYYSRLFAIERIFLLMYIAGTAFFISTFEFDRNIAGRTLATYRLADVCVIVLVVRFLFSGYLRKFSTLSGLVAAIMFVTSKSYMTLVTVGFFNE